ncbi:hypothetical protein [Couchioplanes azureus]|uniref:hypothetical protein n=1 Tax=Couchioplanes caeruleus TaxID=56438 RepID=UPI0016702D35|nr:hypothetical protein [Couchioplanes caeruleus]GGQ87316.1 hypothetical protein GCM10010166_66910 [Couchioplanes caeruleus subsp. azureus]
MSEEDQLRANIRRLETQRVATAEIHEGLKGTIQSPEAHVLQEAYATRDKIVQAGRLDLLPKAEEVIRNLEEKEQAARDAALGLARADEQAADVIAETKKLLDDQGDS